MNENQKQQAESLFFNTDKTQKEIALELGIDPKTLYRWITQGHWRELKSATRRMPSILVENIYSQLDDLNYSISKRERGSRNPGKDESLTISRLVNCINKVQKQTSQGQNIEFMMNFINWMQTKNNDLAKELTEYGSAYLTGTEVQGFHPYDIEYTNISPFEGGQGDVNVEQCSSAQEHDTQLELPFPILDETPGNISLSFGEGRGEVSLAQEHNPNQLELPFPPTSSLCQPLHVHTIKPHNISLSFGEGRGEVSPSIGHDSGIEKAQQNIPQQTENQQQDAQIQMPEMPENNFTEDRAPLASLRGTNLAERYHEQERVTQQSHDSTEHLAQENVPETTNVVSEQGDVEKLDQEQQPEEPPPPRKKKQRPQPEYPIDPKLIYPGSGVHSRKSTRKTLSKEEYDALFRNDEHKNKRRNNKW